MRLMIAILGLVALLSLAACGGGDTDQHAEGHDHAAAGHTHDGDCDPMDAVTKAPEGKVYGAGVASAATMPVSKLLADPEPFLGKTVRVQGPVVNVCKHRGCWIEIASDQEQQKIQLKVNDGEIVFPPEIIGETAIVEGVLEGIPLTHEQACAYLEQEASCQGESFDQSTVPAEGITFYRIKGTGAVVLASAE
jgi:hypothetical protein